MKVEKIFWVLALSLVLVLFSCSGGTRAVGSGVPVDLTDSMFDELLDDSSDSERLLKGDLPIVVDFTASWCAPCQAFAPVFEAAAAELEGKVMFYRADVDVCTELKALFEVYLIPTLAYIPVSGSPTVIEGAPATTEELIATIEEILLK